MSRSQALPALLLFCLVSGSVVFFMARHGAEATKPWHVATNELVDGEIAAQVAAASKKNRPDDPASHGIQPERPSTGERDPTDTLRVTGSSVAPTMVREAASAFRQGQHNAFFDERNFVHSFAAQNGDKGVEALRKELQSTQVLAVLPENVNFMKDVPPEVLDRMAMIDMLGTLSKDDHTALDALVDIARGPIDPDLPPQAIKALVGEKYDAFVELARHDWAMASSTFSALRSESLKEAMRPALIGGLIDSGTPREDALRMVEMI